MISSRRVYKSSQHATSEARQLIETIFVSELLRPSKMLWIVSPWISDLTVIDNTSAAFSGLAPEWGPRSIRLSEVLARIGDLGGAIRIVTRPDDLNVPFVNNLRAVMNEALERALTILERDHLHEKGILGDRYHLAGSMNLTYSGVEINEEFLIYETDSDVLARARRSYSARYSEGSEM